MGANITTYEVRVEVERGQEEYKPICYYGKAEWIRGKLVHMFHIERRTPKQAWKYAERYGRPISCRVADVQAMLGNIENLKLDQPTIYGTGSPYSSAVAMDEMIWKKRNKRRENMRRDKKNY